MRSRNLKPGFFKNEDLAEIEPLGRILYEGLWCMADREGRLEDRPKKIKSEILPYDNIDIDKMLIILHEKGFIVRYSIDSHNLIQVRNFHKHQNPHLKETASELPAPIGHIDSGVIPYYVPPALRDEIFERDGFKCLECGAEEKLTIDHIIPRSRKGDNGKENLRTLCNKCNAGKGNRIGVKSKSTGKSGTRPGKSGTGPEKHQTSRADSLFTDSLNPSTESLNLETPLSSPSAMTAFSVQDLAGLWNEKAPPELARVNLPFKRPAKDMSKVKDALKRNPDKQWWERVIAKLYESPYCRGQIKAWKANFDFMVSHAEVILDGKYDGGGRAIPKSMEGLKDYAERRKP